jgi:hypothetical protein
VITGSAAGTDPFSSLASPRLIRCLQRPFDQRHNLRHCWQGPMGHDSERAAMIYQHQARGTDTAITRAINAHPDAELYRDDDGDSGSADGPAPVS